MKLTAFLHTDGNISVATEGIKISRGTNDKPEEIEIENSIPIDKIQIKKKGKKLEITSK